jgi:hypothetical protein
MYDINMAAPAIWAITILLTDQNLNTSFFDPMQLVQQKWYRMVNIKWENLEYLTR